MSKLGTSQLHGFNSDWRFIWGMHTLFHMARNTRTQLPTVLNDIFHWRRAKPETSGIFSSFWHLLIITFFHYSLYHKGHAVLRLILSHVVVAWFSDSLKSCASCHVIIKHLHQSGMVVSHFSPTGISRMGMNICWLVEIFSDQMNKPSNKGQQTMSGKSKRERP